MVKYVIIGSSAAGTTAAEKIREADAQGEITVISDEGLPFYVREHLNRLIEGKETEDDLFEKGRDVYTKLNAHFIDGRVVDVNSAKNQVLLADNTVISYDKLLLATGGKPYKLTVPGAELEGVTNLYSMHDARRILAKLPAIKNIVFIGGGSIALKMLPVLQKQGKIITIVERQPHLILNMLDSESALMIEKFVREKGVQVITGDEVTGFGGANNVLKEVILKSGKKIPAQLAIVIIGIKPCISVLHNAQLRIEKGVIVDNHMQTSVPNIYAAGDIAQVPDPLFGGKPLLHPGWGEAKSQGEIAGINMAGPATAYDGEVRLNSLSCFEYSFVSGGIITSTDHLKVVSRIQESSRQYLKFFFDGPKLVGGIILGKAFDSKKWKKWLKKQLLAKPAAMGEVNPDNILGLNFFTS